MTARRTASPRYRIGARSAPYVAFVVLASTAFADDVADGNRLYHLGKYEEAAQRYGDALVDSPGSPLIRFNLAAAQYKEGDFADAVASLQKVAPTGDPSFDARVAYNLGNALVRLAESQESAAAQEAIASYEASLVAYKRAIGAEPAWDDPKFNHEVATRKLAALQKRLEEERKKQEEQQQEQQQQEQQEQPPPQDGEQDQEQGEQQPGGAPEEPNQSSEQGEPQPPPEPEPGDGEQQQQEPQPSEAEQPPAEEQPAPPQPGGGGEAVAGEESETDLDRQEAHGVLDTARGEEVRPDELRRLRGPAGVAEPAKDW